MAQYDLVTGIHTTLHIVGTPITAQMLSDILDYPIETVEGILLSSYGVQKYVIDGETCYSSTLNNPESILHPEYIERIRELVINHLY